MTTLTFPHPCRSWARARGSQVAVALVVGLGHAIGFVRLRARLLPGLAGAGMVSYGFAVWHLWTGIAVGGVFLLAMDRQIKLGPRGEQ